MKKAAVVLFSFLVVSIGCKKNAAPFSHVYSFSFQLNDKTYKPTNVSLMWEDSSQLFFVGFSPFPEPRIGSYLWTSNKTINIAGQFIASDNSPANYPNIGLMEFQLYIADTPNSAYRYKVYTCPYWGPYHNPSFPINEDFSLTITAYDSSFIRGAFRGILTDTSNGQQVTIKNGEFNIPYRKQ